MGKVLKLILLCLTVWPLLYVGIFALSGAIEFFYSLNRQILFPLISGGIGLSIIFFYFNELYHNNTIDGQSKIKWFLLFLFTGQVGMMLYWKKYIW